MEAYRDQYATMFNNGHKVAVIAVSVDADTTLASWAAEKSFPMLFVSDRGGEVGKRYGAFDEKNKIDGRALYVIGPDGRVAFHTPSFRALSQAAYTQLAAVVDRLSPPPADSLGG